VEAESLSAARGKPEKSHFMMAFKPAANHLPSALRAAFVNSDFTLHKCSPHNTHFVRMPAFRFKNLLALHLSC
jgi:hypothetical protein